jgi:hypothetical protein
MLSSIIAGFTAGLRSMRACSNGTHKSSAHVFQNIPFSPALPNAVRTASTYNDFIFIFITAEHAKFAERTCSFHLPLILAKEQRDVNKGNN